jgi:hypothetical protein
MDSDDKTGVREFSEIARRRYPSQPNHLAHKNMAHYDFCGRQAV